MPRTKKVDTGRRLYFHKAEVEIRVVGPLHATSPQNPEGVAYMLKHRPTPATVAARQAAGAPIIPMNDLATQVLAETGAEEGKEAMAVFRRHPKDPDKRPFVHENFIIGHLRDAGEAIAREKGIWGLHSFISRTLFVRPKAIYLGKPDDQGQEGPDGQPWPAHYVGSEVLVEEWPTHFDIYRMGRVSSFRRAEFVESPILCFSVLMTPDPKWTPDLLEDLFFQGSMRGLGGGRGRRMGNYTFTLGEWGQVSPREAWSL